MKAVKVRTGTKALLASRAMVTCVLFVLICLPFLLYFQLGLLSLKMNLFYYM